MYMITYGIAQRKLGARMQVAGSTPEGNISTGMQVLAGIFPVEQSLPVTSAGILKYPHMLYTIKHTTHE